MISGRKASGLGEIKGLSLLQPMKVFSRERRDRNMFRYERAFIPPRVGESAAIISSDEIPERRRRRCRGRHADTRTFISQFRLADSFATVTMCNSFERGRHVSTSRQFLQTRAAYASHHRDRQRSRSKVITPGYVLTIATRTPTMAGSGGTRREGGREGLEEGRRCCALPVPYDQVYDRTSHQPAGRIGHVVSKLEFKLAGQLAERKVNHHELLRATLCHSALSYAVFSTLKNCFFALSDKQVSVRGRDTRCGIVSRASYGGSFESLREYR